MDYEISTATNGLLYIHKPTAAIAYREGTNNCQTFVIAGIDTLAAQGAVHFVPILKKFATTFGKFQVLCDVSNNCIGSLDDVFKDNYIVRQKYTNGTGRSLWLCLIDLKFLFPDIEFPSQDIDDEEEDE